MSATIPEASHLTVLLDRDEVALPIVVRLELLAGAGPVEQARLARVLSALPVLTPEDPTWDRIEEWVGRAAAAGERFGIADLLVAALAAEGGISLWSLDHDFRRMAGLRFVELHNLP